MGNGDVVQIEWEWSCCGNSGAMPVRMDRSGSVGEIPVRMGMDRKGVVLVGLRSLSEWKG